MLLANGGPGIPSHNLAEVIAATVAYIEDPAITTSQLLGHLNGPDFPTGGIVLGGEALQSIYDTGSGTSSSAGGRTLNRAHTASG